MQKYLKQLQFSKKKSQENAKNCRIIKKFNQFN